MITKMYDNYDAVFIVSTQIIIIAPSIYKFTAIHRYKQYNNNA